MLRIESDEHSVLIDPHVGGRIVSWKIAGVDVLADAGDHPIRGGMYVMAPWVGRLAHAAVVFERESYPQPLTYKQWAIHGSMPFGPCNVERVSETELRVEHVTPLSWPVEMRVSMSWKVSKLGLTSSAEISTREGSFPAAIGWHPWFLKTLSNGSTATYRLESTQQFQIDEDFIVTGEVIPKTSGPHDDSFIVPTRRAEISWGGFRTVNIETSAEYFHLFETEKLVCLEPETSPPNGVNLLDQGFGYLVTPDQPLTAYAHFLVQT